MNKSYQISNVPSSPILSIVFIPFSPKFLLWFDFFICNSHQDVTVSFSFENTNAWVLLHLAWIKEFCMCAILHISSMYTKLSSNSIICSNFNAIESWTSITTYIRLSLPQLLELLCLQHKWQLQNVIFVALV